MIIEKVLNNNVVVTRSEAAVETVIMGRGLAFGKSAGDRVDAARIEKTFTITDAALMANCTSCLRPAYGAYPA